MSEATEHKNIHAALLAAQKEFGRVIKGSTNPAFKSKYADLADVANVIIPTMNNNGCSVSHRLTGENLEIMRTVFYHVASETELFSDVPLIVNKNDMQGMKSATTYAKRIGLESLSGIAPEDDDGNGAAAAPPRSFQAQERAPLAGPPPQSKSSADDDYTRWQAIIYGTNNADELRAWGLSNRPHKEHRYRSNFDQAIIERIAAIKENQSEMEPA
jgi:hypothetical protein